MSDAAPPEELEKSASDLIDQFGMQALMAVHQSDQDGLLYFSANGTIEYLNEAAKQLFDCSDKVIGRSIWDIADNDFEAFGADLVLPSDHFDQATQAYEQGMAARSELVAIYDDDRRREVEVVWGPVRRDDDIVGIVGSYRDASPRSELHDQLADQASELENERDFLTTALDGLDDGLFIYDPGLNVHLANQLTRDWFGLDQPVDSEPIADAVRTAGFDRPKRLVEQLRYTASSARKISAVHYLNIDDARLRLEVTTETVGVVDPRFVCRLRDTTDRTELQQMTLLEAVGRLGDTSDRDHFADDLVDLLAGELNIDFAILGSFDADRQTLNPLAWRGVLLNEDVSLETTEFPDVDAALQSRKPVRFDRWIWRERADTDVKQQIIPVFRHGRPIGTVHLGYVGASKPDALWSPIEDFDSRFLRALGTTTASAWAAAGETEIRTPSGRPDVLEETLEHLPGGVLLFDENGDVHLANQSAREITEIEHWDNLNTARRPYRLCNPAGDPLPRNQWPFFEVVRTRERCEKEIILDFDSHQKRVICGAGPLGPADREPALFVGTIHDITRRSRVDRRKDEFLSIASHELRSPLTPLIGVLQLARHQRERGSEVDLSLLTRAERQVSRLMRLVDGLLDLTRIETDDLELDREPVDLGELVEDCIEPWRHAPGDVDLEIDTPPGPVMVDADPDRLEQVLSNLVDNAVKYSKSDGAICIEVFRGSDCVGFAVEDNGVGMDEETVSRIFDRFFHGEQLDGRPRSMGLGLYLCRQIVEKHDGDIQVDSKEGVGTRVRVELPPT